jgi:hypothetical protein
MPTQCRQSRYTPERPGPPEVRLAATGDRCNRPGKLFFSRSGELPPCSRRATDLEREPLTVISRSSLSVGSFPLSTDALPLLPP